MQYTITHSTDYMGKYTEDGVLALEDPENSQGRFKILSGSYSKPVPVFQGQSSG